MLLCYIDESGTPDIPGNTSHYVLAGLAVPISCWNLYEDNITEIKKKYNLHDSEIHTAWILRKYLEQSKIPNFESFNYDRRIYEVKRARHQIILSLQKVGGKKYLQTKKNFKKTESYIHLTYEERVSLINELAVCISKWKNARLFAECIDKLYFDPNRAPCTIDEQALEQLVTRFQTYLQIYTKSLKYKQYGLLIHDNNETVAKKHTELMRKYYRDGTFWKRINNIIETPLFVNSELTSLIQIADLCSYALRRYLEKGEDSLFEQIFTRGDRNQNGKCVGIRHFSDPSCGCIICSCH